MTRFWPSITLTPMPSRCATCWWPRTLRWFLPCKSCSFWRRHRKWYFWSWLHENVFLLHLRGRGGGYDGCGHFLEPCCCSVHKRVPRFSYGMLRVKGINSCVELWEKTTAKPPLPPKNRHLPQWFELGILQSYSFIWLICAITYSSSAQHLTKK